MPKLLLMGALAESQIAVATGFVFVWRSISQVLGVSVASAVFQGSLSAELAKRFDDPAVRKLPVACTLAPVELIV